MKNAFGSGVNVGKLTIHVVIVTLCRPCLEMPLNSKRQIDDNNNAVEYRYPPKTFSKNLHELLGFSHLISVNRKQYSLPPRGPDLTILCLSLRTLIGIIAERRDKGIFEASRRVIKPTMLLRHIRRVGKRIDNRLKRRLTFPLVEFEFVVPGILAQIVLRIELHFPIDANLVLRIRTLAAISSIHTGIGVGRYAGAGPVLRRSPALAGKLTAARFAGVECGLAVEVGDADRGTGGDGSAARGRFVVGEAAGGKRRDDAVGGLGDSDFGEAGVTADVGAWLVPE